MIQLDGIQLTSQTSCYVEITKMLSSSRREIRVIGSKKKSVNFLLLCVFRCKVLRAFVFLFIPSPIHSIDTSYMSCIAMSWSYIQHVGFI